MYTTSNRFDTCLILSRTTGSRQYHDSRVNLGLTQRAPARLYHLLKCLLPLCQALFVEKVLEVVLQGHVASDHGGLVILSGPGRSGGDEPGFKAIGGCIHKQRALNTRLSSGTFTGTFAVSGALTQITNPKQVRKTNMTHFCTSSTKGLENWSSRFVNFFFKGFRSTLNKTV